MSRRESEGLAFTVRGREREGESDSSLEGVGIGVERKRKENVPLRRALPFPDVVSGSSKSLLSRQRVGCRDGRCKPAGHVIPHANRAQGGRSIGRCSVVALCGDPSSVDPWFIQSDAEEGSTARRGDPTDRGTLAHRRRREAPTKIKRRQLRCGKNPRTSDKGNGVSSNQTVFFAR